MKRFAATIALTLIATLASFANAQQFNQIRWKFDMHASLTGNGTMKGLYINSLDSYGAAARAGLRQGDVIMSSNGMTFNNAFNDYQAVSILQDSVDRNLGGVPTASFQQTMQPSALLTVVRNGHQFTVQVFPRNNSSGVPTVGVPTGNPGQHFPPPGQGGGCSQGGGGGVPTATTSR